MDVLLDTFFFVAGVCLLVHIGLCIWLQRRLRAREDLLQELFAIPNEAVTRDGNVGVRLLRARYYLPWVRPALHNFQLDSLDRIVLAAGRITGLVVPIACLTFFILSFVQAA
jgi:hypothetical protein